MGKTSNPWGDTPGKLGEASQMLLRLWTTTNQSTREIAHSLGKSYAAVEHKIARLRVWARANGVSFARPRQVGKPSVFTDKDEKVLRESSNPNEMTIDYQGRIRTLEQLLVFCEVDPEVWKVERYIVNKWEVGSKLKEVHLDFDEGKISGSINQEPEITIEPLIQVKAWLIRLHPIEISPLVSPVMLIVTPVAPPEKIKSAGQTHLGLILCDPQFGFKKSLRTAELTPLHDRTAIDVGLQIAQDYDFEFIAFNGDLMDLADWSDKFTRDPNFYWTTQPAAIEAKWWLTQFRLANPSARMKLFEGNHEKRLRDSLVNHMQEAFGIRSVDALELPPLMSIPRILALHDLDIEWIGNYPEGEAWINDFIVVEHGSKVRAKSGGTVSAMVLEVNETRIIGHIHRIEQATRTIHAREGPRPVTVFSPGCLCRIDGIVPAATPRVNWQNGIGIIEYRLDGGFDHNVIAVPINSGRAIYNGKVYEGKDRVEEIRRDVSAMYEDGRGWNF